MDTRMHVMTIDGFEAVSTAQCLHSGVRTFSMYRTKLVSAMSSNIANLLHLCTKYNVNINLLKPTGYEMQQQI